tara:strand:+ start:6590 stop:6928 length:339 start_codon:yes stop_codon:yes gene_type:complete
MGATTFKRIDRQRYKKLYPALRKTPKMATISDKSILLESTSLAFTESSGITSATYVFSNAFESIPTVTHGVTSTAGDMVIARIIELTTTQVVIEVTAAFDGTVDLQVLKVED